MADTPIYTTDTEYGHYEVVETTYNNRPARVVYSGSGLTAQSGIALDGQAELLFDYNQRFLELIRALQPHRVLLIGGGACTLPTVLQTEFPGMHLDIVEIDLELVKIGECYFGFEPNNHTNVQIMDGEDYLKKNKQMYDLILLDAFFESTIPSIFQTKEVAILFAKHLREGGVLAINIIASYYGQRSWTLRRQISTLQEAFSNLQLFPAGLEPSQWVVQNFLVVAQNGERGIAQHLRYASLALPDNTGDAFYRS